jgi:phage tail sheath protein FI
MPAALNYPGVYIEELSSGVRTITGVATSICAFVGYTNKGPTDRAELVLSWSDFVRKFGGLDRASLMSYAVAQFFANGGAQAYIVRLVTLGSDTATDNAKAASVDVGGMTVSASSPGEWGNKYAISTKLRADADPSDKRFQLSVLDMTDSTTGVVVESFENLSVSPDSPRYAANVLRDESSLVAVTIPNTVTAPPADTTAAKLATGANGKKMAPNEAAFEKALNPTSGVGGIYLLDRIDLFNLLCVPGESNPAVLGPLQAFCRQRRAFLIADCAQDATLTSVQTLNGLTGADSINAALYFPWVKAPDPLQENRLSEFPPCGFVAGLYARTDSARGVWKAPAGVDASLTGALGVKTALTNDENGVLNPKAVNCIRNFPVYGTVLWGARTLQGNDERGSEWKYVPVRRMALFMEETLFRALKWVVFEPNDEPLWAQIRLNVGAFLRDLFRQGAFQGKTPQEAYFVKCDKETTTQNDINRGIVNILVGFAPLKPAEFVVVKIQQIAGQIQT